MSKLFTYFSTSPRFKEDDLEALYGKYYPRKELKIDEIINQSKNCQKKLNSNNKMVFGY